MNKRPVGLKDDKKPDGIFMPRQKKPFGVFTPSGVADRLGGALYHRFYFMGAGIRNPDTRVDVSPLH